MAPLTPGAGQFAMIEQPREVGRIVRDDLHLVAAGAVASERPVRLRA